MADLIIKQAMLAMNTTWQNRVRLAMLVAMTSVEGEAVGGMSDAVYGKRQNHALEVLRNPVAWIERYSWAVATNSTIAAAIAAPVAITSSTNANPIVFTTATHGYTTGDTVEILNHLTNTNGNGGWVITVVTSTTFSVPQAGNGVGTGGTATKQPNDSDLQFTVNSLISDFAGVTAKD